MNIPKIGLGTRNLLWDQCEYIVEKAIEIGYNHIDTAQIYWNEEYVGNWIRNSRINRENIFLTTKIWVDNLKKSKVISSFDESLSKLKIDYLDLILIHWPTNLENHHEVLDILMELQSLWKVKNIWVSNFNLTQLLDAQKYTWWKIYNHQFEFHAFLLQEKNLEACKENNIIVTAYSPLSHWHLKSPVLEKIAQKYDKSVAQVWLKRLVQVHDAVVIPKTSNPLRLVENKSIFDFELDKDDIDQINSLPKKYRYINPYFSPKWEE